MDNGTEFDNSTINALFLDKGIIPIYNTPGDSASNGIAERANLTFLNDCRTLLQLSNIPPSYWFHAVEYSTFMRNTLFNSSIKDSARAKTGLAGLDTSTILPFGQYVIVHNHNTKSMLEARGLRGYALRPSKKSYDHIIYVPSKI